MRRGRIVIGVALLLSAVSLGGATSAFAASPQDICSDLADGKIDGSYTSAEWTAFFSDPTISGYGCNGVTTPAGSQSGGGAIPVTSVSGVKGTTLHGVKGAQHTASGSATRAAGTPLGTTRASGTLPFTGIQLALFTLVGLALVGTGLLLRSTAKPKPTHRT